MPKAIFFLLTGDFCVWGVRGLGFRDYRARVQGHKGPGMRRICFQVGFRGLRASPVPLVLGPLKF